MICNILGIITPFLLNILCVALLRIREKILHIGDMLLEYIFLHFGPTCSVYKFGIFTYGPICPTLSINIPLSRTSLALLYVTRAPLRNPRCRRSWSSGRAVPHCRTVQTGVEQAGRAALRLGKTAAHHKSIAHYKSMAHHSLGHIIV
jgi:hypothetical protein